MDDDFESVVGDEGAMAVRDEDVIGLLQRLLSQTAYPDTTGRLRVAIETAAATLTAVTTVTTLSNITSIGGLNAAGDQVQAFNNLANQTYARIDVS